MFVGYGKHPFLIALRLLMQGIESSIATRSVGDSNALRLATFVATLRNSSNSKKFYWKTGYFKSHSLIK